jgi:ligand-binding SRPBCC domain-containing protein
MTACFECTTRVSAPIERVFDLALSIDAHLGSMVKFNESAVGGVTSGQIGLGQEVTWRARHFGVNWTMTNRIGELERPMFFSDEQVRGPFKRFRHEHTFMIVDDCTEVVDVVCFEAPLRLAGAFVERGLCRYLRRLIEGRNSFMKQGAERQPEDPI